MSANTHKTVNKSHDFDLPRLLELLPNIEDPDYWERLCPGAAITADPFARAEASVGVTAEQRARYLGQLRTDGYFQSGVCLSESTLGEMRSCVENVVAAGYPPIFALVYDVFYRALGGFDDLLCTLLGPNYQLIPNFWVYHIGMSDDERGFEPHRDAEYTDTIGADGLPRVITTWIAITDATPLNGCIHVVPKGRDPRYCEAISNLATPVSVTSLEDVRAIPARAGTLSGWDQYISHWGGHSSQWAQQPRLSYALYFQRGDMEPLDGTAFTPPAKLDFGARLEIICGGLMRYSFVGLRNSESAAPLLAFADRHLRGRQPS